ncbi:hypothetical protein ACFL6Y_10930 [Elusimicrobiota bacterium]
MDKFKNLQVCIASIANRCVAFSGGARTNSPTEMCDCIRSWDFQNAIKEPDGWQLGRKRMLILSVAEDLANRGYLVEAWDKDSGTHYRLLTPKGIALARAYNEALESNANKASDGEGYDDSEEDARCYKKLLNHKFKFNGNNADSMPDVDGDEPDFGSDVIHC